MRALAAMALMLACRLALADAAAPPSTVLLDIGRDRVAAELRLPAAELAAALGQPLPASPLPLDGQAWVVVARYLASHLHVRGPDGRAWSVEPGDMRLALDARTVALAIHADFIPPPGASPRRFALDVDVIGRERPAAVRVVLRGDWDGGRLDGARTLATLRFPSTHLDVDAGPGDSWRGWLAAARLGMRQLAAAPGELLFLVILLATLPAARPGRHHTHATAPATAHPTTHPTPARAVRVAAAYAFGHTLTLVAGGLGWVSAPRDVIDAAGALALLAAGAHALRPLFAGREGRVAVGVGLAHGLACAGGFAALRLDPAQAVRAVLAFHGGVELVQAATVAAALPCLALAAGRPGQRWLRAGAGWTGTAAGAVALGSLATRHGIDPMAALSGVVRSTAWLPVCALTVLAGFALVAYAAARGRATTASGTAGSGGAWRMHGHAGMPHPLSLPRER